MRNTTLCYLIKDGRCLMLYRNKKQNDPNDGKWLGIGGGIEKGETPDVCVVREVREETGLELTSFRQRGIIHFRSDGFDEDMYLYSADGFTGDIKEDCNEGELVWVDIDKVPELNLWEGDIHFLRPLFEGRENINMTLIYEGDSLTEVTEE